MIAFTTPCPNDRLDIIARELRTVSTRRTGHAHRRLPGGVGHLELVFWHPGLNLHASIRIPLHPKAAYRQGVQNARPNAARIIAQLHTKEGV